MADTTNIRKFRRKVFGPSIKDLHLTLVQQKKLETGHHAQLENYLSNHGLLLVQIIQSLGQMAIAINEIRDRSTVTGEAQLSVPAQRFDALESMIDALASLQQPAGNDGGAGPQAMQRPLLEISGRDEGLHRHSVIGDLQDIRIQLADIREQSSLPQLAGQIANVENALVNVSAMVSDLVGGGLASRLDVLQGMLAELGGKAQLQAIHGEGLNTLLDAQNLQIRGLADDLRATASTAGGNANSEISGKLDNVLNALSNLASVANDAAASSRAAEISGKLDNLANALLNIGAMVSGLVGDAAGARLERLEKAQGELNERVEKLSTAILDIGRHIDDALARSDVSARLARIERALGGPE